jgi:DNA-binding transcriptional MerR regulator
MTITELINEIPHLTKRFVYYLEERGYIHPLKIPKDRLDRRDYTEADVELIRKAFRLYRQGYSPRRAIASVKTAESDGNINVFSLRLPFFRDMDEKIYEHAGSNQSEYIFIIPKTQFMVTAKRREKNLFSLRVSMNIDKQYGPFIIRFLSGGENIRELTTDIDGNAFQDGIEEKDIKALIGCEVDVSKRNDQPKAGDISA